MRNNNRTYKLRLYVVGDTTLSQAAIKNLDAICQDELKDRYEIEVIDILEQPELAEKEKIVAAPTLVKHYPGPVRRIVGDLSDHGLVVDNLAA